MRVEKVEQLLLMTKERNTLIDAKDLLYEIGSLVEKGHQICVYDANEIFRACIIIESILDMDE